MILNQNIYFLCYFYCIETMDYFLKIEYLRSCNNLSLFKVTFIFYLLSNVTDIHAILEITVLDEDKNKVYEFLGKIEIPINSVKSFRFFTNDIINSFLKLIFYHTR